MSGPNTSIGCSSVPDELRVSEDRPMSRQSGARGFPTPDGNLRAAIRYLEKSVQAAPCENPEREIGTYIHNDSPRCLDRDTGEDEVSLVFAITFSIRIFYPYFGPPDLPDLLGC